MPSAQERDGQSADASSASDWAQRAAGKTSVKPDLEATASADDWTVAAVVAEAPATSHISWGGKRLQLRIWPSTAWTAGDLAQLASLVAERNKYVCMQLVEMAREQASKLAAAQAAGDMPALLAARHVYLATAASLDDEDAGQVVAAALFYPRPGSKAAAAAEQAHVYVELLCCNAPGHGFGGLLLSHIEAFVFGAADLLSAGLAAAQAAATQAAAQAEGAALQQQLAEAATAALLPPQGAHLPLVLEGAPALLPGCCAGCATPSPACSEASMSASASSASLAASEPGVAPPAAAPAAAARRRIAGIRLLSVERVVGFYARLGYSPPDSLAHEMFKPLAHACSRLRLGKPR